MGHLHHHDRGWLSLASIATAVLVLALMVAAALGH
jgi:hypothetical protein